MRRGALAMTRRSSTMTHRPSTYARKRSMPVGVEFSGAWAMGASATARTAAQAAMPSHADAANHPRLRRVPTRFITSHLLSQPVEYVRLNGGTHRLVASS